MDILEIVMLIVGGTIFALGYILPKKREELDEDTKKLAGEQIRSILDHEIASVQSKIEDVMTETIEETSSETERALEKMTNEKIMAINEYSDTVIDDINKNHKEVLFLYDMLNDKHVTIRNTVTEVEKTVGEVTQTAKDIEISAKETAKDAKNSEEAVKRAADITSRAEKAAELTAQNMELDMRRIVEDMIRGRVEETLEKTAGPMIQERVDEILSDAALFMEQQPKILVEGMPENVAVESPVEVEEEHFVAEDAAVAELLAHVTEKEEMAFAEEESLSDMAPAEAEAEFDEVEYEPESDFVEGITKGVPKIVIEGEDEENLQYYVLESEEPIFNGRSVVEQTEENNGNSNEKILSLHKAGMSNVAIAKELGLGVGEVKLVIDLFEGMQK